MLMTDQSTDDRGGNIRCRCPMGKAKNSTQIHIYKNKNRMVYFHTNLHISQIIFNKVNTMLRYILVKNYNPCKIGCSHSSAAENTTLVGCNAEPLRQLHE
jgi:hypothetical protein